MTVTSHRIFQSVSVRIRSTANSASMISPSVLTRTIFFALRLLVATTILSSIFLIVIFFIFRVLRGKKISCEGSFEPCNLILLLTYNQAYNFFLDNDKLNSQAQVDTIKGDIEAAANALVNYGIKVDKNNPSSFDVSKANASGKVIRDDMLKRINNLGEEYGIEGSYDPVKDVLTLKWDGGEFNSEDLIKQTGSESMVPPMVIGAALVLVVIAAGGFVYTRSRKIKD